MHTTLIADVCETIYRLKQLFKWICAKEIKISDLPDLQEQAVELACHMEMFFPPSVFDIQVHLIVHLVDDVEYAGLVHYRWMYFVDRFLK